jgi:hypothetical protein
MFIHYLKPKLPNSLAIDLVQSTYGFKYSYCWYFSNVHLNSLSRIASLCYLLCTLLFYSVYNALAFNELMFFCMLLIIFGTSCSKILEVTEKPYVSELIIKVNNYLLWLCINCMIIDIIECKSFTRSEYAEGSRDWINECCKERPTISLAQKIIWRFVPGELDGWGYKRVNHQMPY